MKKHLISILLTLITLVLWSCSTKQTSGSFHSKDYYHVSKIKKIKDFYVIELMRNDSVFTALSLVNGTEIGKKIRKGNNYTLSLKKIFPAERRIAYDGKTSAPFVFRNVKIKRNIRNHWSVYIITNMSGVFLME